MEHLMAMECPSCTLTVAMRKAVSMSTVSGQTKNSVVSLFVGGYKTFKESCMELGLSTDQMRSILDEQYWNATMK